jgi:flagellar basal-body rod modification protein FlgD
MVASVSNSSATSQASSANALTSGTQALGEQDFLTLLVAQLKNQDPLQPQDDSAFVAQLAQFSGLEQQMQTNTSLSQIMTQLQGQSNAQLASLVGTNVTIQGSTATLDGSGNAVPITFMMNSASTKTTATLTDSTGNVVRTIDLGAQNLGLVQFTWNGRDTAGNLQPAGDYAVSIAATGSNNSPISVSQNISGTVSSVSFDQGSAAVNLQNGVSAPMSQLLQVGSPPSNP